MCSNPQQLAPQNGLVQINTANTHLDGTGAIADLITGDILANHGTYVNAITIKAIAPVAEGMIRLYLNTGTGYKLINEIRVPASNQSGTSAAFRTTVYFNTLFLAPGVILSVSTQTADTFIISASAQRIVGYVA